MLGSVGWRWKGVQSPHEIGSSISKSSLPEAFDERGHTLPLNPMECDIFRRLLLEPHAAQQLPTGAQAGTRQWRYDMAYVQCMYTKGHRVPDGAPPPPSPQTVPPPPVPGPPRS
jgi:hypothetical protein